MSEIFSAYAPQYWAHGLPVIPLRIKDKKPFDFNWTRFAEAMPTDEEQALWLQQFKMNNMGLPLGPCSGIAVFDVDTEDERVLKALDTLLPHSPWKRVGKKGYVIAVQYDPAITTFRIKDISGKTLVEYLSKGTQVVLPPSIHPDTNRPYTANCNLYDVIDSLPVMDQDIEKKLREMLKEAKIELSYSGSSKIIEWVPHGGRDVKMIEQAGLYAYAVTRGERTLLEALGMLQSWKTDFVAPVAGDDIDIEKGQQRLIQFVQRDVLQNGKILPKGWDKDLTAEDLAELGLSFTEDNLEWSEDQIRVYLRDEFQKHTGEAGSSKRTSAIEYALNKIAKAKTLSTLSKETLLCYIKDSAGLSISLAALRKRTLELEKGPIEGINHTEIARAVKDEFELVSPIKFDGAHFRKWNGSHWEILHRAIILNTISEKFGALQAARKNSDHKGILQTMEVMINGRLDEHPIKGINFANGVLLEDGSMVPHNQAYGMTYTLGFRYIPTEAHKCEKFINFLADMWSLDEDYADKVAALQEAICATIFGFGPKYQRAVLLLGPPRTGKSQLLDIIQSLVPDEARSAVPPENWGDIVMNGNLKGKLLNYCGELSENRMIAGDSFKLIIDGSEITGKQLYVQPYSFKPICMHWFGSNHAPRANDSSAGFTRRWLILKCDQVVPPEKIVRNLGEEIVLQEREAIVAWAVEALHRLRENRDFTLPLSHLVEIGDLNKANNSIRYFFEESGKVEFTQNNQDVILEDSLHLAYRYFCNQESAAKPVMKARFRRMMAELCQQYKVKRVMTRELGRDVVAYQGIRFIEKRMG